LKQNKQSKQAKSIIPADGAELTKAIQKGKLFGLAKQDRADEKGREEREQHANAKANAEAPESANSEFE
jgi:hypothetical protein